MTHVGDLSRTCADEDHVALHAACETGVGLCTIVGIDGSFSGALAHSLLSCQMEQRLEASPPAVWKHSSLPTCARPKGRKLSVTVTVPRKSISVSPAAAGWTFSSTRIRTMKLADRSCVCWRIAVPGPLHCHRRRFCPYGSISTIEDRCAGRRARAESLQAVGRSGWRKHRDSLGRRDVLGHASANRTA